MKFKKGQKIVCINDSWKPMVLHADNPPKLNHVYTVENPCVMYAGYISLEEIGGIAPNGHRWSFDERAFRPVRVEYKRSSTEAVLELLTELDIKTE